MSLLPVYMSHDITCTSIGQEELEKQDKQETVRLSQFCLVPSLRMALFISIVLHLALQLSGINGVRDCGRRVGERRGRVEER